MNIDEVAEMLVKLDTDNVLTREIIDKIFREFNANVKEEKISA